MTFRPPAFVFFLSSILVGMLQAGEPADLQQAYQAIRGTTLPTSEAAYLQSLGGNDGALGQVVELRSELRSEVGRLIQQASGSEVDLAVTRSRVDFLVGKLQAVEEALGSRVNARQMEWAYLSSSDLTRLNELANEQSRSLANQLERFPKGEAPSPLLHRKREVDQWRSGVERELTYRRQGGSQVRMPSAEQFASRQDSVTAALDSFSGNKAAAAYERRLQVQVELRLDRAPRDAALIKLKKELRVLRPRPPPLNSPQAYSAQQKPLEAFTADVENAARVERSAFSGRDQIGASRARARLGRLHKWAQVATPQSGDVGPELSSVPVESLYSDEFLKTEWREWSEVRTNLEKQSLVDIDDGTLELEKAEVKKRLKRIEDVIARRSRPPPPGDGSSGTGGSSVRSPPPKLPPSEPGTAIDLREELVKSEGRISRDVGRFEETATRYEQQRYAVELQKELDRPAAIRDSRLLNELETTQRQLGENTRRVLRDGRGTVASDSIRSYEDSLRTGRQPSTANATSRQLNISQEARELERVISRQPPRRVSSLKLPKRVMDSGFSLDGFDRVYAPNDVKARSYKTLIRNPATAPGGVILDGVLSEQNANSIRAVYLDDWSLELFIQVAREENAEAKWVLCDVRLTPELARQAWAFAQDERVVAIDLRRLSAAEVHGLIRWATSSARGTRVTADSLAILQLLTKVNLHPAWTRTEVGWELIRADQVVFDILPVEFNRLQGTASRLRLPIDDLRAAFNRDTQSLIGHPPSSQHAFYKSIVSSVALGLEIDGNVAKLEPQMRYELFLIPRNARDTRYTALRHTSKWLTENGGLLSKRIPHLSKLREIAAIVGLFQSVKRSGIEHNLEFLTYTDVKGVDTPDVLVNEQSFSELQELFGDDTTTAR